MATSHLESPEEGLASLESQGQRSTDDCSKIRPSPVDHILDSDQRDNFVESPSTSAMDGFSAALAALPFDGSPLTRPSRDRNPTFG